MTLTFNSDTYNNLLVKYQPKVIKTEAENERSILLAEELEHLFQRTPEEEALLELLVLLIEKFEEERYPIPQFPEQSILHHLIEENGLNPKDLAEILGSSNVASEIFDGKLNLSQHQARQLADYFNIDIELLKC
ncbi:MAG: transcriptional regulator [Cyanobacteriota bacterium]|nr:transcriptional regulator [Cyanobacteriota bacterium]